MKKVLLLSVMMMSVITVFAQKANKLQVVYFHAKYRCPTCLSIEENTKKTLNTYFADKLKSGVITFVSLDVSEKENEAMVEKYEADGSSLFLTQVNGNKEKTTDFTNFAFSYSRNQAEKFIAGLKAEIEKNLK